MDRSIDHSQHLSEKPVLRPHDKVRDSSELLRECIDLIATGEDSFRFASKFESFGEGSISVAFAWTTTRRVANMIYSVHRYEEHPSIRWQYADDVLLLPHARFL
jgi:hypothetical protein